MMRRTLEKPCKLLSSDFAVMCLNFTQASLIETTLLPSGGTAADRPKTSALPPFPTFTDSPAPRAAAALVAASAASAPPSKRPGANNNGVTEPTTTPTATDPQEQLPTRQPCSTDITTSSTGSVSGNGTRDATGADSVPQVHRLDARPSLCLNMSSSHCGSCVDFPPQPPVSKSESLDSQLSGGLELLMATAGATAAATTSFSTNSRFAARPATPTALFPALLTSGPRHQWYHNVAASHIVVEAAAAGESWQHQPQQTQQDAFGYDVSAGRDGTAAAPAAAAAWHPWSGTQGQQLQQEEEPHCCEEQQCPPPSSPSCFAPPLLLPTRLLAATQEQQRHRDYHYHHHLPDQRWCCAPNFVERDSSPRFFHNPAAACADDSSFFRVENQQSHLSPLRGGDGSGGRSYGAVPGEVLRTPPCGSRYPEVPPTLTPAALLSTRIQQQQTPQHHSHDSCPARLHGRLPDVHAAAEQQQQQQDDCDLSHLADGSIATMIMRVLAFVLPDVQVPIADVLPLPHVILVQFRTHRRYFLCPPKLACDGGAVLANIVTGPADRGLDVGEVVAVGPPLDRHAWVQLRNCRDKTVSVPLHYFPFLPLASSAPMMANADAAPARKNETSVAAGDDCREAVEVDAMHACDLVDVPVLTRVATMAEIARANITNEIYARDVMTLLEIYHRYGCQYIARSSCRRRSRNGDYPSHGGGAESSRMTPEQRARVAGIARAMDEEGWLGGSIDLTEEAAVCREKAAYEEAGLIGAAGGGASVVSPTRMPSVTAWAGALDTLTRFPNFEPVCAVAVYLKFLSVSVQADGARVTIYYDDKNRTKIAPLVDALSRTLCPVYGHARLWFHSLSHVGEAPAHAYAFAPRSDAPSVVIGRAFAVHMAVTHAYHERERQPSAVELYSTAVDAYGVRRTIEPPPRRGPLFQSSHM